MKVVNHKVKFHNKYPTNIDIYCEKAVEVYIDQFNFDPIPKDTIRIIVLEEPLRDSMFTLVQSYKDYYNYVLTYDDDVLYKNPKARLFRGAETWVYGYKPIEKRFAVSTVVGGKNDLRMKGYAMRHELWRNKDSITIPKEFYLSANFRWKEVDYNNNLVLGGTKNALFDCMFHIAIENTQMKHYFSEKLLDCFQTRTIPIYYGCSNIDEYFNIYGIIIANSVKEIIDSCNKLTPDVYNSFLPAAEDNYIRAQKRINYFDQLKDTIINLLNEI